MKKTLFTLLALALLSSGARAETVKVTMNGTSPTMTLADKTTGEAVETGDPEGRTYTFSAAPGTYVLTAYAKDATTISGTIELQVNSGAPEGGESDADTQEFSVLTCTIAALNGGWVMDEDYTVTVDVVTREGQPVVQTLGWSTVEGRRTFLAFNGNSFYAAFIPNEAHQEEGYMTAYRSNTLTGGINVLETIHKGADYTLELPADAELFVGTKTAHYIPYNEVQPVSTVTEGDVKRVTYHLTDYQVYNYRTWREGQLTQGGYFTMRADPELRPQIGFTAADYEAFGPLTVKHDVAWNGGYETGDIFVNINERGHLRLDVGQTYDARALRSWQLTDTQTNNYFIEPDFHYTVVGLDGQPCEGVIEIDNADTTTDPWSTIKAVGKGTVLVLVTYDAIGLNYYESGKTERHNYMGGQYWGAIWPENTAVYVVSVGEQEASLDANMVINEAYNEDTKKMAGKYVDAEHDVFYYLDTDEGYRYTFMPTGVSTVEMARPTIGERMATYTGFGDEGVTKNDDGSYTLLLKEGRQIVRLTDAEGRAAYQVLTAKTCHREIINASRPGSHIYQPGDHLKVQYTGLRHPANKMSGIYNMSAYVTYNGTPNGTSLILSPNQYTFGSAASAQAVTIDIPADYDVEQDGAELVMDDGVIQVNGYGDPIGNHRYTSRTSGRSPNFTAVAHKTYFGAIPEVRLQLQPVRYFTVRPVADVEGASFTISPAATDNGDGTFTATYGDYLLTASAPGYRCQRTAFTIADDAEGDQVVSVTMTPATLPATWDGQTLTEPQTDDEDIYQISTGAELAWFSQHVNDGQAYRSRAVLTADIDLGDYDWTPIGGAKKQTAYQGQFDGQGHTVSGLYIDRPSETHQALFGMLMGRPNMYNDDDQNVATVSRVTVEGTVRCRQYAAGVVAYQDNYNTVDRCVNRATVVATEGFAGGVSAFHNEYTSTTSNSYNEATITTPTTGGGVVGRNFITSRVTNVFSTGEVVCPKSAGACVGGGYTKEYVTNAFSTYAYDVTESNTLVTPEQMAGGEVAWLLGEAFGQRLGEDLHPVLDGPRVFKVLYTIAPSAEDPSSADGNLESPTDSLFTNGPLPTQLQEGYIATWHTEDGTVVTEVTSDTTLYVVLAVDGISLPQSTAQPSAVYDLQGRRTSMLQRGLVIIRHEDGTASKHVLRSAK